MGYRVPKAPPEVCERTLFGLPLVSKAGIFLCSLGGLKTRLPRVPALCPLCAHSVPTVQATVPVVPTAVPVVPTAVPAVPTAAPDLPAAVPAVPRAVYSPLGVRASQFLNLSVFEFSLP